MFLLVTHHSLILLRDAHPLVRKDTIGHQIAACGIDAHGERRASGGVRLHKAGQTLRYANIQLHHSLVASQLVCNVVIASISLASFHTRSSREAREETNLWPYSLVFSVLSLAPFAQAMCFSPHANVAGKLRTLQQHDAQELIQARVLSHSCAFLTSFAFFA